jgi:hypothetical protein
VHAPTGSTPARTMIATIVVIGVRAIRRNIRPDAVNRFPAPASDP